MLSSIVTSAAINALLAAGAAILCSFFLRYLWQDMIESRNIGSVGFFLLFVTVWCFDVWDALVYTALAWNGGDTRTVLPFTLLKPAIHSFEIVAYLMLRLHFRKGDDGYL